MFPVLQPGLAHVGEAEVELWPAALTDCWGQFMYFGNVMGSSASQQQLQLSELSEQLTSCGPRSVTLTAATGWQCASSSSFTFELLANGPLVCVLYSSGPFSCTSLSVRSEKHVSKIN